MNTTQWYEYLLSRLNGIEEEFNDSQDDDFNNKVKTEFFYGQYAELEILYESLDSPDNEVILEQVYDKFSSVGALLLSYR